MDDDVDLVEQAVERAAVTKVGPGKGEAGVIGKRCERSLRGRADERGHVVAGVQRLGHGVGADEPGRAGDEDPHDTTSGAAPTDRPATSRSIRRLVASMSAGVTGSSVPAASAV